jgi:RNA polymerase sigma-70 factor (ECF subfamily)
VSRRRPAGSRDPERVKVFDELYEATFTRILAFCRRRTRSLADAEDAVAEVYLVAWRKLDDATSAEQPLLWLYSVAARVVANQHRGQDRLRRLKDRLGRVVDRRRVPGADEPVLTAASAADVAAALQQLRPLDRELLRLIAYERLTYAEAGMVAGLSEAAVRSRVFRARQRLRAHLDETRRDDPGLSDTSLDGAPTRRPGDGREGQP